MSAIEVRQYSYELPKKSQLRVVDEEYIEEEQSVKTPFAFDLGVEYQRAQRYGTSYLPFFIENVHYYVKESYARVPVATYEHMILYDQQGKAELVFGESNESARQSYLAPAWDSSKPDWYRKRAYKDVLALEALEEMLEGAQIGDTFIDLSPTEYDVSVQERKENGFGYHSFARIHRVVDEDGVKILISRAIRNYLDRPEQAVLFKRLTGQDIDVKKILGETRKVSSDLTPAGIRAISDELYRNTPLDRKIIPPDEELDHIKSEQEMDKSLLEMDFWLKAIFKMMLRNADPETVLENLRGYEMAIKDMVKGEKINTFTLNSKSTDQILVLIYGQSSFFADFANRPYTAGFNGCGLGSGFGTVESSARFQGPMSYQNMTSNENKNLDCPEIKCGNCSWKASEREVKKVQDGKLKECPRCEWSPKSGAKKREDHDKKMEQGKVVDLKKKRLRKSYGLDSPQDLSPTIVGDRKNQDKEAA